MAVVLVGAVPPVVLGLVVHLAVLRTQDGQDGTGDGPGRRNETTGREAVPPNAAVPTGTVPRTERTVPGTGSFAPTGRRYASEDELLDAAGVADARHRTRFGKPITRDQLRRELRIGGDRATGVLRKLRETSR